MSWISGVGLTTFTSPLLSRVSLPIWLCLFSFKEMCFIECSLQMAAYEARRCYIRDQPQTHPETKSQAQESNNVLTDGNGKWYSIIGRSSTNTTVTMTTASSTISNTDLYKWFFPPSCPRFSLTGVSLDAIEDEWRLVSCDCCNTVCSHYYSLYITH